MIIFDIFQFISEKLIKNHLAAIETTPRISQNEFLFVASVSSCDLGDSHVSTSFLGGR